jgi:hypothetical protein
MARDSSGIAVYLYQAIRRHIPEYSNINFHRRQSHKSHTDATEFK